MFRVDEFRGVPAHDIANDRSLDCLEQRSFEDVDREAFVAPRERIRLCEHAVSMRAGEEMRVVDGAV